MEFALVGKTKQKQDTLINMQLQVLIKNVVGDYIILDRMGREGLTEKVTFTQRHVLSVLMTCIKTQ